MIPLLLVSSGAALVLLVIHSWKTRGRRVTLAFFVSGILFGMLRGNVVWLTGWLLYGPEARTPYVIAEGPIPPLGHESLQAAVGWTFALYLAWTVSELILRRFASFAGRVFMTAGLSALFMAAICYCIETTAVAVGWWHWTLPATSLLWGRTNVEAMEAWFSLVPCFLIPFLVIVSAERSGRAPRRRWLWLLVYPGYVLGHVLYALSPWGYPTYILLELLVVGLMMFHPLRIARGSINPDAHAGTVARLPAAALAIFFGMLVAANVVGGAGMEGQATLLPMLMLCVLAWRRMPATAAVALSLLAAGAGWAWIGPRALWALAPVAAFGFLKLLELAREALWLRLVPVATLAVLATAAIALQVADRSAQESYYHTWILEDLLESQGRTSEAAAAWKRVEDLRPRNPMGQYVVALSMCWVDVQEPGGAEMFHRRLPHVVGELEDIVRRDPSWVEPREDLAEYDLVEGRAADAIAQYREICRLRSTDRKAAAMLGYLLLREGEVKEAEAVLEKAARAGKPSAAALVDLGVARFAGRSDDRARSLWEEALRLDPGNSVARMNLDRLKSASAARGIDWRMLTEPRERADMAPLYLGLSRRQGASAAEKLRLAREAAQCDPEWIAPQLRLSALYLGEGPAQNAELAVWHARRALDLARENPRRNDLANSLLALGRALLAVGDRPGARFALEEGRHYAAPPQLPEFDDLLRPSRP